ncbi:Protein of unknown function DUF1998 [Caldicellulosiruptor acetigenus I77R1B]|uniref:MrfA-like Zn-binding domain-containing protein n=1 Tax=Caldicellulosiruptor acetigenus (strain ATCC 700853 / DSM 12137 / I77R1B) TaxID=632335 RepID=E4S5T4_CALA7|nr:Protein of unknown function DUF1998 [Caldicellulosiruptor acetigenus I77R1B]
MPQQQIRKSQFILTYGPGSILESVTGPRIIPGPLAGLFNRPVNGKNLSPVDFEISHQRLTEGLFRNGTRIFRIPSNAELGIEENVPLYTTRPFPGWGLCIDHGILYRLGDDCPECKRSGGRWKKKRREAIRFVRACPAGHLDDVDWNYVVHSKSKRTAECTGEWFYWQRQGASLKEIKIRCPVCKAEVNMGEIYNRPWPCSGRFPERETEGFPVRPGCRREARIIQRQASNLRIPEVVTLFTVPPRHTKLHRLLENQAIRTAVITAGSLGTQLNCNNFLKMLEDLRRQSLITEVTYEEILKYDWREIESALQDLKKPVPQSYREILVDEFNRLVDAAYNGASAGGRGSAELLFEVIKQDIRTFRSPGGLNFRIVPVTRLNTVTVQTGYRRFVCSKPEETELVDISFTDERGNRWLPGIEFMGEGIFVMLEKDDENHFQFGGKNYSKWLNAYRNRRNENYNQPGLFRDDMYRDELHPVFVWWHTLSHIILRTLSVGSGYSLSSIRERIYFDIDRDGHARGGIIFYTVQPGADGTLGGLVSLVPHFGEILSRVHQMAEKCSNDPLCGEQEFAPGKSNGAACYACTMVSETSCEHRNMWLDRHILVENMP